MPYLRPRSLTINVSINQRDPVTANADPLVDAETPPVPDGFDPEKIYHELLAEQSPEVQAMIQQGTSRLQA